MAEPEPKIRRVSPGPTRSAVDVLQRLATSVGASREELVRGFAEALVHDEKFVQAFEDIRALRDPIFIFGSSMKESMEGIKEALLRKGFPASSMVDVESLWFADGSNNVKIRTSVRGRAVYILQTGSSYMEKGKQHSIADAYVELRNLVDACQRSDTRRITLVLPNFFFARQDKKTDSREPISASWVAADFEGKVERVVCLDLHAAQIQGMFHQTTVDNLYAMYFVFVPWIKARFDLSKVVIVSPDQGRAKATKKIAQTLGCAVAVIEKVRNYAAANVVEESKVVEGAEVLKGRIAIVNDDIIDTAGTMVAACDALLKYGTTDVTVIAVHGLLNGAALERIGNSKAISKVVVTDSVPQEAHRSCPKLEVLPLHDFWAEAFWRLETNQSLQRLFA
eukprot:TRINITY_DN3935_c0_g1_i1.p1 TRINITY_DN3935_c0_g1~~TRINITY_DN3935_c0_g1_i1.p1  ORF type:complete len:394 (+),score=110.39 TRINITY_DN3935_c0_g1_i1:43-1224(+)